MCLLLANAAWAADTVFDLAGHFQPEARATITLFGDTFPFVASTVSGEDGRFRFHKLRPGPYTVAVFIAERGEARQTIEVGPSGADARRRVVVEIRFKDADFERADTLRRRNTISRERLAIAEAAQRDYEEAHKDLARRDPGAATAHLEEAVRLAPQFADAWNELGTIAYQTHKYARAEECFREALKRDPKAFEPLVNLGGVLVTVHRSEEALKYNTKAVEGRPNDAPANSQMGMNYYELGDPDRSIQYLERARAMDPAHFSHPQLLLARIYEQRGEKKEAAEVLEEFLRYHPDWPEAARLRESIAALRK